MSHLLALVSKFVLCFSLSFARCSLWKDDGGRDARAFVLDAAVGMLQGEFMLCVSLGNSFSVWLLLLTSS